MKLATAVVFTKGWCLATGAMAAAIATGIIQVDDVRQLFGLSTKMWSLFLGAYSVGCNALVAFLSQSFGQYTAQMRADSGQPPMPPPPMSVGKLPIDTAEGRTSVMP